MCVFLQQFGRERFLQLESQYRTFRSLESWDIGSRVPRGVYAYRRIILEKKCIFSGYFVGSVSCSSQITCMEACATSNQNISDFPYFCFAKSLGFCSSVIIIMRVNNLQKAVTYCNFSCSNRLFSYLLILSLTYYV